MYIYLCFGEKKSVFTFLIKISLERVRKNVEQAMSNVGTKINKWNRKGENFGKI